MIPRRKADAPARKDRCGNDQSDTVSPYLKHFRLMRMAIEGYGVAWLPQSAVVDELERGVLVRAGG